ncbi:DUF3768 domain-containing protein [Paracoccus ravus]|uniref:DUF3768 domain-containing protein n=1 Tax=Paracoccus ravus TaxID=2447760 RepID=UPI0014309943|nr:DUF3768 domain-containing protein [Paracoccus ravus]
MAHYQCKSCGEIEISELCAPEVCTQCGESGTIDLDAQTAEIAKANDAFRAAIIQGGHPELLGQVVWTQGVAAEGLGFMARAQIEVAGFSSFTEENDPYGDHSFGAVTISGKKIWWKIDIYDADYRFGAADPLDATQTRRVLTLLFPSEY